jgi:hypothetical protein
MDGYATVAEVAAERRSSGEMVPLRARNADRSSVRADPQSTPSSARGSACVSAGQPPPCGRRVATAAPGTALFPRGRCEDARDPLAAPPPDTVVVASLRHASALEEQAKAREAALRAEHAAEMERLADALRHQRETHAAEIEGLRAEHAAVLRRIVEAQRQARDRARTGAGPRIGPGGREAGAQARSPARRPVTRREWLARLTGRC